MKRPLLVDGMHGLGDNIYARPIIRQLSQSWAVFLMTPWPELYCDMPDVFPVNPNTKLRTQAKNALVQQKWFEAPEDCYNIRLRYGHGLENTTIVNQLCERFGYNPYNLKWDLPDLAHFRIGADKPIVLVRPVTVRKEWPNASRNPLPEYVARVTEKLYKDYCVVSVADLEDGEEWALEPLPPAHLYLHGGETSVTDLISLVWQARAVIGGVGWIVPACLATQTPLFCILGGNGAYNAPERLVHPSVNSRHVGWGKPDKFCQCKEMDHSCNKKIQNLDLQFLGWRHAEGL